MLSVAVLIDKQIFGAIEWRHKNSINHCSGIYGMILGSIGSPDQRKTLLDRDFMNQRKVLHLQLFYSPIFLPRITDMSHKTASQNDTVPGTGVE